jgi:hypothetical protein
MTTEVLLYTAWFEKRETDFMVRMGSEDAGNLQLVRPRAAGMCSSHEETAKTAMLESIIDELPTHRDHGDDGRQNQTA